MRYIKSLQSILAMQSDEYMWDVDAHIVIFISVVLARHFSVLVALLKWAVPTLFISSRSVYIPPGDVIYL